MDILGTIRRILGDKLTEDDVAKLTTELPKGDEGIEKLLARLETKTSDPEVTRVFRDMLEAKEKEIASLRATVDDQRTKLTAYETDKADREKTLREEQERQKAEKVENLIEEAKKDGRLPSDNEDVIASYRGLLTADIDNGTKVLSSLPKTPTRTTPEDKGKPTTPTTPTVDQIDADALAVFSNSTT